jgi:hypothetical protein
MRTLKESILDDIEITMNKGQHDVIIDMLFDKDDLTRQNGIDILYKTVIDTNPKLIASANKIKTSDKYFIHFSDIRIGQHDDKKINNIILLKHNVDDNCIVLSIIGIGRASFYRPIVAYKEDIKNWNRTLRSTLKSKDGELYEVPEELNSLFEQMEKETNKRIA